MLCDARDSCFSTETGLCNSHSCSTSVRTFLSKLLTIVSGIPQALHDIYSRGNWILAHSWFWNIPAIFTGSPQQWKQLYLIFPALKQESTSITQTLQVCKSNFRTLLVVHACFRTRNAIKLIFDNCRGCAILVDSSLSAGIHSRSGFVEVVQACLSTRNVL